MAIAINGSGTVTGISVGGLPDGIVDTDMLAANAVATAKIANNAVTGPKRGAGAVLQVVTDIDSGQFTTSSNSWQWQGLDVSITPASTDNKVLVLVGLALDGQGNQAFMTLYRGTDNLGGTEGFGAVQEDGNNDRSIVGFSYLDSPSSTSSVQYRVAVRNGNNSTTIECPPWANGKQSIVAMEIQG